MTTSRETFKDKKANVQRIVEEKSRNDPVRNGDSELLNKSPIIFIKNRFN